MSADPRVSTEAGLARLGAQIEGISREIGQMRTESTERLERIEVQTTRTNGRVDNHERRLTQIETREDERKQQAEKDERRRDRRERWAIALSGIAATSAIAVLGWIVTSS